MAGNRAKAKRRGAATALAALTLMAAAPGAPFSAVSLAHAQSSNVVFDDEYAEGQAPIPQLAPRTRREAPPTPPQMRPKGLAERRPAAAPALAKAGQAFGAARDHVKSLASRLTIGAFSVNPPGPAPQTDEADSAVADAIRRAFAGRRLDDLAKGDSGLPMKPRSGSVGYVLADPSKGAILERHNADDRLIPASVSKAPTALYALDALGPDFRFETQLVATGRIRSGVLQGDLYLVGGGDPSLDNKDLAAMAEALRKAGVERVAGGFFYDDGLIPERFAIEASQPPQAGYNPAISGLNINFNRVRISWERERKNVYRFGVRTVAHGRSRETDLIGAEAAAPGRAAQGFELVERPVVRGPAGLQGGRPVWRIASNFLGKKGGRWVPVREPGKLAAHLFQEIAFEEGVSLPTPRRAAAPERTHMLARHRSARLAELLRSMLKHSTNLTAEAVGLLASRARGLPRLELERSGALMSSWADTRFGILGSTAGVDAAPTAFQNHSGLSVESRLTARGMTAILIEAARDPEDFDTFFELLPRYRVRGLAKGAQVRAKTGTVYYGRGLSGYLECPRGKRLAFTYLHSDIEGRSKFDDKFNPANGAISWRAGSWIRRAKTIERDLLKRWARRHC